MVFIKSKTKMKNRRILMKNIREKVEERKLARAS